MNEKTMFKLTYGLFVLTAWENGRDNGCIINTAGQVTMTPNCISVTVNKANYTHDMIMHTGKFNLSILSEEAAFDVFQRFGFQSGRDKDKIKGYEGVKRSNNGICYVTEGTNGFISGTVKQSIDLGTHTLFIAEADDMEVLSGAASATYSYYHEHIKPKPEKVGVTAEGKTVWRCRICGYEYEGDELPDDFICPICKHPASDFEKVTQQEKK